MRFLPNLNMSRSPLFCRFIPLVLALLLALSFSSRFLHAADPNWNGYVPQGNPAALHGGMLPVAIEANPATVQYYLLRTGFLLEGTASAEGKNYAIRTDFGTIHVPVTNVEFVGQTKQDVYHYKKNSVDAGNCNELMKLAEWCLGHALKNEAVSEYERALRVAPNTTLAEVIRQRLRAAADAEAKSDTANANELESRSLSGVPAPDRSEDSEIERWVAALPKPLVEQYVKRVQPVLLSGCAAADCHGTNSSHRFKIAKPRQLIGTTSYGNLQAVLPWINLDYPTDSALLTAMISYHGGEKPAYSVESRQYDNVIQWIQLAAKELPLHVPPGGPTVAMQATTMQASTMQAPVTPTQTTDRATGSLLPPHFQKLAAKQPAAVPPNRNAGPDIVSNAVINAAEHGKTVKTRPQQEEVQKEDPFDPSIFNARYHGTTLLR